MLSIFMAIEFELEFNSSFNTIMAYHKGEQKRKRVPNTDVEKCLNIFGTLEFMLQ